LRKWCRLRGLSTGYPTATLLVVAIALAFWSPEAVSLNMFGRDYVPAYKLDDVPSTDRQPVF
jgi:hypothetical protein